MSNLVGNRLSDIQEQEHGETTRELTRLGPEGLETLDTLIMAGTAATRAQAIRWALDHPRAARLPAAPRTKKRSRQAQERVLRQAPARR